MKNYETQALRQKIAADISEGIRLLNTQFKTMTVRELNYKEKAEKWSVGQCLEHLNRYSDYYNPAIRKAVEKCEAENRPASPTFKPGFWGNKFTEMLGPENVKKQKTIKKMDPADSRTDENTLLRFQAHQTELAELWTRACATDLNRPAVPVEFFPLMKLKIGDAFRFLINHQLRHLQQAVRAQKAIPVETEA